MFYAVVVLEELLLVFLAETAHLSVAFVLLLAELALQNLELLL